MNIENRTIYCKDNLDILREIDNNCIDMIYLDPPFNSNKYWHAPVGAHAEGASFKDIFGSDDVDPAWMLQWGKERPELYHFVKSMYIYADISDASYIQYMAIRMIECHRILKETGTLFYHCDHVMNDYVKIMLDIIFGRGHDINNIVWTYTGGSDRGKGFGRKHDNIFFYRKGENYKFNKLYTPFADSTIARFNKIDENGRKYKITYPGTPKEYRTYMKEEGKLMPDYWNIPIITKSNAEGTGYPTQKPLTLLKRIIECSTDEGDMVLDPFCGCATTCVAAENLNRQWVGIDVSIKAFELVKDRIADNADLFNSDEINLELNPPKRNITSNKETKYVYIISNPSLEGYKVGIATNAEKRLRSYQTGDPERGYEIEYTIKTTDWLEIEKAVHNHFPNKHEWVQAELKEIKKYVECEVEKRN